MTKNLLAGLIVLVLTGCTAMKPADFADTEPKLDLFDYFTGKSRAWGIFEDRFGTLRRQFIVDIDGVITPDNMLVLTEDFAYSDGELDQRIWRIRDTGNGTYEGNADDIIGKASGVAAGNALNWRYDMDLNIGDMSVRVTFDDWMFLQPGGVLVNRARVSKWGVEIGEVTLFFTKEPAAAASAE